MAKQSKFFRVLVEGDTADGREVSRQDILDAAATYNRDTYGARMNMEHIRGVTPDGPFKAYGDVIAVKTELVDLELAGKTSKKTALFAQLEPTDELIAFNQKKQKIFTSCELQPNFANSGRTYLVGLAVTDSPASLGTEMLKFAAGQGDANPLASRKLAPGNLFTAAQEVKLEFVEAEPDAPSEATGFFAAALAELKKLTAGSKPAEPEPVTPPAPANDNAQFTQLLGAVEKLGAGMTALSTQVAGEIAKLRGEQEALKLSIDTTDRDTTHRPPANGGRNFALADC